MKKQPPKRPLQFLRWFCREDYLEEIEGNLIEIFEQQCETSPGRAKRSFFWQVLLHFRPDFIRPFSPSIIQQGMLKHNLLITYRGFLRNKTTFLINLIGLSTGLACVLLIYLWVFDEWNTDKFHDNDARLFQVMQNLDLGQEMITNDITPLPLAQALMEEIPEVEKAVAVNDFFNWRSRYGLLALGEEKKEVEALIAGPEYFKVFSYDLFQGKKDEVLKYKNGVVISEQLAEYFFENSSDAIGQSLDWQHLGFDGNFQVTGVFKNPPANATQQFDAVFNIEQLTENDQWADRWTGSTVNTYVVLHKNADIGLFNAKIKDFIQQKAPEMSYSTLFAQKYSNKYLFGNYENGHPVAGRMSYVKLFSIIALFILLIACINFMNLSTAKASLKMKEIGVKKTIGASRGILIVQFLSESILLSFLSVIIAVLLVVYLLPQFNQIAGKEIQLNFTPGLIGTFLGIGLLTGILAGSYPAFYLSRLKPLMVLKGKLNSSFRTLWIRKGLVVFQFGLSLSFIIGLVILTQQIKLTQTKNLGYNRDNIISFKWKGKLYDTWSGWLDGKSNEKFYSFLSRLDDLPAVLSKTNMSGNILNDIYRQGGISWGEEDGEKFLFQSPVVGYDFLKTLDIELIAGRSFSQAHNDDYSTVIINEKAAELMGVDNPVGKTIRMNGTSEIIGVVKNFHYGSFHNALEPLIFRLEPNGNHIMARIKAGAEKETIAQIKALYAEFLPGHKLDYTFLDEDYQALYESEKRVADLSKYFAGLAIIISCLGLFGLVAFTTERRKKEIGIRKVLGANIWGIVRLLNGDFTKTVVLSIFTFLPLSYWLANNWLARFSYHIDLNVWLFLGPAFLVLLIAWLTAGLHTVKAARSNPVNCLKDE